MKPLRAITPRRIVKPEILILYYALQHKLTPVYAKLPALVAFFYLLSPVDIIPDVIPFAGYIDDMVVVPLLLQLTLKLLPVQVREDSLAKAAKHARKLRIMAVIGVLMILLLMVGMFLLVRKIIVG
jgi:uncharacterized membrane protein YkvA (DUF1232 family)